MNLNTATASSESAAVHLDTTRMHCDRILVPTDFTRQSTAALKAAASFARLFGATILVVHCLPPLTYAAGLDAVPFELLEEGKDRVRTQLSEEVNACREMQGIDHEEVVETGPLLDVINSLVTRYGIGMVVCGSHGASGLEKLVAGSTAEYLLRHLNCPALVIGPNSAATAQIRSILFCTRLGTNAHRPAQYAASLAEEMNARLTLLHVASLDELDPSNEAVIEGFTQRLRALLPADADNWCQPKTSIGYGDFTAAVRVAAHQEMADMIVMGVSEAALADHAPWGALSCVIREAHCPVLAVRGHLV